MRISITIEDATGGSDHTFTVGPATGAATSSVGPGLDAGGAPNELTEPGPAANTMQAAADALSAGPAPEVE